ncbi:formate dehydrogenase accessory sulfurtransferase FdhD [Verrucomicrobia bacterium]|nr:formate dehydrogenase accessory sulfurtransferase FdhD [Verrucomicrobiota bacterium]
MQESKTVKIQRWKEGGLQSTESDAVATEEPLEIRVRGRSIAITMRTPGHDEELAAGFLVTENIIHHRQDVSEIAHCREGEAAQLGNTMNVFLTPEVDVDFGQLTRHFFASSSCGLCGKASIESVHQQFPPVDNLLEVSAKMLASLPDKLRVAQPTFDQTGGLHAAGLFSMDGFLTVSREDIGRHNAVDKVIGYAFLDQVDLSQSILLVSGRASFEIMQKALAARIPIVAAVSAPSSLAVEFAQDSRQTLAGFVRGKTMNVYAGTQRVR